MARRIRSIKPEILDDTKTAFLTHLEYRLFVGTWIVADDHGNLRGEPEYVRGQIVWASSESRETVASALATLVRVGLLTPYTVRGQIYLHVTNWSKHQRIDKPSKAAMPGIEQADPVESHEHSECSRPLPESSRESRESLLPDRDQDQDQDQEGEREGDQDIPPKASKEVRAHRLDPAWVPERSEANLKAEMAAKARGVDLREELVKMHDWAKSNGAKRKDWNATWRNWTRNARPAQRAGSPANNRHSSQSVLTNLLTDIEILEREELEKARNA